MPSVSLRYIFKETVTYSYVYSMIKFLPSQVIVGEQHWLGSVTDVSLHTEPEGHPPLSIEHENSQYAFPVSLHTLQVDPLGHLTPAHAGTK